MTIGNHTSKEQCVKKTAAAKNIAIPYTVFHAVFFTIMPAKTKNITVYTRSTSVDIKAGLPPDASVRSKRLACVRG